MPCPEGWGHDTSNVFFILKDVSKENADGKSQFAAFVRHARPWMCPVNAMGAYLLALHGRRGVSSTPDIFNGNEDWTAPGKAPLLVVQNARGKLESMAYNASESKARKGKEKSLGDVDTAIDIVALEEDAVENHSYVVGSYDVFLKAKVAAGLERINKVTHLRLYGAMYASQLGASKEEIELLGRWLSEKDATVCAHHYLRNIPIGALMACSGRYDTYGGRATFTCPQSRVLGDETNLSDIEADEDLMKLLDFIAPGWFSDARRARAAERGCPEVPTDPVSVTNRNFTLARLACAIVWLQDAVPMLREMPELEREYPYNLFQGCETDVESAWKSWRKRVARELDEDTATDKEMQLELHQMMSHFSVGMSKVQSNIINTVPKDTIAMIDRRQQQQHLNAARMHAEAAGAIVVLPDDASDGMIDVTGAEKATENNLNLKRTSTLYKQSAKMESILGMVTFWEDTIVPLGNKRWWTQGNATQTGIRSKHKLLHTRIIGLQKILQEERTTAAEVTLQEAVEAFVNTLDAQASWSDIECVLRSGARLDCADDVQEVIAKRREAEKARRATQKEERRNAE